MSFSALVFVLVTAALAPVALADDLGESEEAADPAEIELPGGQCLACHLTTEDAVGELWRDDVHARAGISCVTCHGGDDTKGDKDLAKRPGTKYRGALTPRQVVDSCGGCHSDADYMKERKPLLPIDQLEKYWTSHHGKLLKEGEPKVAQCASCHHAHGIREVNDAKSPVYASNVPATCGHCHADAEYMSEFGIKTDQYEQYVDSVHGKALLEKNDVRGAPACNDCHGNHGAAPPSVAAITHICGACHSYNAELFLGSPLAPAFRERSLADCVACHGKHEITHTSDAWLEDEPGGACRKCHETGDEGSELALYFADSMESVHRSFE